LARYLDERENEELEKLHGNKITCDKKSSLQLRVCLWIITDKKELTNDSLRVIEQTINGIHCPFICGEIITSKTTTPTMSYAIPDNKSYVHANFLCAKHYAIFHLHVEKQLGIHVGNIFGETSELSVDSDIDPKTFQCTQVPPPLSNYKKAELRAKVKAKKGMNC